MTDRKEIENKIKGAYPDFNEKTELEKIQLVYLYTSAFFDGKQIGIDEAFSVMRGEIDTNTEFGFVSPVENKGVVIL